MIIIMLHHSLRNHRINTKLAIYIADNVCYTLFSIRKCQSEMFLIFAKIKESKKKKFKKCSKVF